MPRVFGIEPQGALWAITSNGATIMVVRSREEAEAIVRQAGGVIDVPVEPDAAPEVAESIRAKQEEDDQSEEPPRGD